MATWAVQVALCAMRVLATILAGSNAQTAVVVEAGGVELLNHILNTAPTRGPLLQECCFALSNITAGTHSQIQASKLGKPLQKPRKKL
jgi:hypothetical protein